MKVPCKNCTDRHYKCHSECEKYLKFLKENEKRKEVMMRESKIHNDDMERLKRWWR